VVELFAVNVWVADFTAGFGRGANYTSSTVFSTIAGSYAYDGLDHLTQESYDYFSPPYIFVSKIGYIYDPDGNRIREDTYFEGWSTPYDVATYDYNANNQLTTDVYQQNTPYVTGSRFNTCQKLRRSSVFHSQAF
jgi:hypothetical protein